MTNTLKVAVVIYEPITSDMSKAYRGLKTALELVRAGDDVVVLFDGSGVETLAAISAADSPLQPVIRALSENVIGSCAFCAASHGVDVAIKEAGWPLLGDDNGEASVRSLLVQGYQILNF